MAFIEDLQKYFGQQDISINFHLPKYDVIATHKFVNRCISENTAGLAVRERFKQ